MFFPSHSLHTSPFSFPSLLFSLLPFLPLLLLLLVLEVLTFNGPSASTISFFLGLKARTTKRKAEEVLEDNPRDPNQKTMWEQLNSEDPMTYFSYFAQNPLSLDLGDDENGTG